MELSLEFARPAQNFFMRFNGAVKFHADKEFYEFCIAKFRCALQNSVPPKTLRRCETPVQPNLAAVIKF